MIRVPAKNNSPRTPFFLRPFTIKNPYSVYRPHLRPDPYPASICPRICRPRSKRRPTW